MSRMRLSLGVAAIVLVAGCAAPAAATAPPAAAPSAAATTAAAPPAGAVALTGDVRTPTVLAKADLAGLPQQTVSVSFGTEKGPQQHSETGVALSALLPADKLATTAKKNDILSFAVVAVGADGYSAAFGYGDVSADFGNRGLLVALTEDGKPLDRPRLVVPGDVKGGRYVSDLTELHVVRLGS
jgi:hypothetical protein